MNYNVVLRDECCLTVEGELIFLEFLRSVENSELVQIWDIERNRLVCEGANNQTKVQSSKINEYDTQIKIFNMLKAMEDKYGVKFILTKNTEEDKEQEQLLHMLLMAWESREVEAHFTEFTASFSDKQGIINMIEIVEKKEKSMFSFDSTQTISGDLFGVEIEFLLEEKYDMLILEDIHLVKSKLEFFEDGELMKISFTPHKKAKVYKKNKNNKYELLKIPSSQITTTTLLIVNGKPF